MGRSGTSNDASRSPVRVRALPVTPLATRLWEPRRAQRRVRPPTEQEPGPTSWPKPGPTPAEAPGSLSPTPPAAPRMTSPHGQPMGIFAPVVPVKPAVPFLRAGVANRGRAEGDRGKLLHPRLHAQLHTPMHPSAPPTLLCATPREASRTAGLISEAPHRAKSQQTFEASSRMPQSRLPHSFSPVAIRSAVELRTWVFF